MPPTITVLCNEEMTKLLAPVARSKPVMGHYSEFVVAEYDEADLAAVTEERCNAANAWWRECGYANITIEFDEAQIREGGVFGYLEQTYGISTEKNLALAFREMADDAGMTPVDFGNWIAENAPTPKQVADRVAAQLDALWGTAR